MEAIARVADRVVFPNMTSLASDRPDSTSSMEGMEDAMLNLPKIEEPTKDEESKSPIKNSQKVVVTASTD